ncbi:2-C-methyl-D-erythritol 2,4-cyclodiphosphate synthase, chloroplastic-like [Nicotiana tabacum]|uniref:2-C-methyl-D-erythritol 2,4-cyclodiphosphate synthase n=1 Tax=Nicotiana tabacum TaxID=4097 RepID=W8SGD9_TOBAC|nr:2-C-methyl-D-erythritol 2,4-cyclodiphosphate synthase, chloroplastic-like [Nicotiana tabacum]AHM22925.1 2-C-methyl-D-erythritol 2,4-cyclodiphosphate synthase [Nicotiana tabacum]
MAMASSLFISTPIPTKSISKQIPFSFPSSNPIIRSFTHKPSRNLVVSSSAAATNAIEAEPQTSNSATTPAKSLPFRVGHGFDLHRLEPGYPLIIGGINIPHDRGCEAHSDGDVLLHCVVDAILGALGLPDIGQIFPDTDPKWKGAPSSVFMEEAVRLMHEAGYELGNLDATSILQRPKVSPHKEAIRANLCKLLGADPSVVNLKAKTHEKVDSLGENRSIAAHTVVLLMKK